MVAIMKWPTALVKNNAFTELLHPAARGPVYNHIISLGRILVWSNT